MLTDHFPDTHQEKIETNSEATQKLLNLVGDSPVISQVEDRINEDLQTRGVTNQNDKVLVLTKHLAGTQILLGFEKMYDIIFGSQIALLNLLNENREQGIDIITVNAHINLVKADYPEILGKWTNKEYLDFLIINSVISKEDDRLYIKQLGIEFLAWMVREGRTTHKQL